MSENSTLKWVVGTVIGLIAAGGGAVTWMKYLTEPPRERPAPSWNSLQPAYLESFDIQYVDERARALWPSFKEGAWSATTKNGTYCFENRVEETGARYTFVEMTDQDISDSPTSVEVRTTRLARSTPLSGAGLLYRFDTSNRFYYAFTLTSEGQANLHKRNQAGYSLLYTARVEGVRGDQRNKVAMVGRGSMLHLFVNDALVKTIEDPELQRGATGIVALGIGTHCFDNVTIYKNVAGIPGGGAPR